MAYMVFAYGGILFSFMILLCAFLGTHELMKHLKTNLYRYPIGFIILFICLIFQLTILDIYKRESQIPAVQEILLMYGLLISTGIIIWLFSSSLYLIREKQKSKLLEGSIVIGIIQVAIAMIIAGDSRVSIYLKLIANMMYLALPALALYELPKLANTNNRFSPRHNISTYLNLKRKRNRS